MAAPVAAVRGPVRRWNTLRTLRASRGTLIALDILLLAAMIAGVHIHRAAVQTVGKDAGPSIIAAQHIKSALAAMDAAAADELLGAPGAASAFDSRRTEAAKALIAAAENITYGETERAPIQTLELGMGSYEGLIQRARDLRERGDAKFADAYRDAAKLMDETLLPAAEALDKANEDVLERTYRTQAARSASSRGAVAATGVLLIVALLAVQFSVARRMRRILNPALLASTFLAWGVVAYSVTAMSDAQAQLKIAREDAFNSIHALWRARAGGYAANAEESRYLLSPTHAAGSDGASAPGRYLAEAQKNVTFAGERDAVDNALARFNEYGSIDQRIRQLQTTGHHREAVELCIGTQPGQSDWAFDRFDKALGQALAINQSAFDSAVANGFAAVKGMEIQAAAFAAALAMLVIIGLAPRIREYE